jgi:hypothetical protein
MLFLLLTGCIMQLIDPPSQPRKNCDQNFLEYRWKVPKSISNEWDQDTTCIFFAPDGKFFMWTETDATSIEKWECTQDFDFRIHPFGVFTVEQNYNLKTQQPEYEFVADLTYDDNGGFFKTYEGTLTRCPLYRIYEWEEDYDFDYHWQ